MFSHEAKSHSLENIIPIIELDMDYQHQLTQLVDIHHMSVIDKDIVLTSDLIIFNIFF